MNYEDRIYQIINSNVLEITKKVTGIVLTASKPVKLLNPKTLYLCTKGSYQLELFLHADEKLLEQIASTMKHEAATKEEIPLYTTEFFNILAGRIVSAINQLYKQSVRFQPPVFCDDELHPEAASEDSVILYYQYESESTGSLSIEGQLVKTSS